MNKNLARIIRESKNAVFFGGAGVSTESGIPDFRSEKGLYSARQKYGRPPEELLSRSFFMREPETFFQYYLDNLIYRDAKPNAAHTALAWLEDAGKLSAVVTQNIDGLHQAAGSRTVFELHGSVSRNHCMDCGEKYPLEYVISPDRRRGRIPLCPKCEGIVRPDIVLYEEPLDEAVWSGAVRAIERADALIVGGTSLAVYPAAGLLQYFRGQYLVLINRTETPFDSRADLVVRDSIGKVLAEAEQELRNQM